jgi:hypothetical protein
MPFPIQIEALLVCRMNLPNLPLMTSQDYPSLVGHELQLSSSTLPLTRVIDQISTYILLFLIHFLHSVVILVPLTIQTLSQFTILPSTNS